MKLISMWQRQGYAEHVQTISLTKGKHLLQLDYFQGDGSSAVALKARIGDEGELVFLSNPNISAPKLVNGKSVCG